MLNRPLYVSFSTWGPLVASMSRWNLRGSRKRFPNVFAVWNSFIQLIIVTHHLPMLFAAAGTSPRNAKSKTKRGVSSLVQIVKTAIGLPSAGALMYRKNQKRILLKPLPHFPVTLSLGAWYPLLPLKKYHTRKSRLQDLNPFLLLPLFHKNPSWICHPINCRPLSIGDLAGHYCSLQSPAMTSPCTNLLKIMTWNANGISGHTLILSQFLKDHAVDIACISETKLALSNKIYFPNFKIFRIDRSSNGGRVAILVKNSLNAISIRADALPCKLVGIRLNPDSSNCLNIFCVYSSPPLDMDLSNLPSLFDNNTPTIITGDLNAKHHSWDCGEH